MLNKFVHIMLGLYCLSYLIQVRIMRKRLVRKTFDMIQDLADSENKEVSISKHF